MPRLNDRSSARSSLRDVQRVIVKIGTKSIAADGKKSSRFSEVASDIVALRNQGRSVVLVSSGAVAMGCALLGFKKRPQAIAKLQASAAAGQPLLMRAYEEAFSVHGVNVAQVLLTHADVTDRERYLNARAALEALAELGAVPIINENDTVSVEEIKFGDNDQLAAMVAALMGADLLVLLTNVDGVLDDQGRTVPLIKDSSEVSKWVKAAVSEVSLGGMTSKVDAATKATHSGVPVVIANAMQKDVLARIVAGEPLGTLFLPKEARMASRKHWIAFALKPKGVLVVDSGAVRAVTTGKRSLLPAGVVGVRGDFAPGDPVSVVSPEGREVARGLVRYGIVDAARLSGARTDEIAQRIGHYAGDELIHRDDLVLVDMNKHAEADTEPNHGSME